ncbi:hypothetical protein [Saccharospirillum sp.]|uniref:hypothetical protein n=1 Tax=Saccharospirillum sp. TaxID=2033801 RepID=UPI0034A06882
MKFNKTITTTVLASVLIIMLAGCDKDSPLEDAGEQMDDTIEDTGDAVEDATDGN